MIPKIPEENQMQAIITLLSDIHTNANLQNEVLVELLAASRNVDKKEIEALLSDRHEAIGLELTTWMA